MTVSTGTETPVEQTRVALGRPLRVALVHGREEASRLAVVHLAVASGAEIVARVRATDPRSFVEAAQALRDARPDVVVIHGGGKDQRALAELLEALRLGCAAQRPMPRIFGLVDTGVDHVVARASLDNVRRWLPWPIDAPALLERVFNRARLPDVPATTEAAVLLEMALAREAIAHALRNAAEAGFDVAAMRSAPSILITGRVASFPKAGQSLLVLVDGLEPSAVSTVFREPDAGRAERIGMVGSVTARGSAKIRILLAV